MNILIEKTRARKLSLLILAVFSLSALAADEKKTENLAPATKLNQVSQLLLGDEEPLKVQPHLYNPRRLINLREIQKEVLNSDVHEEDEEKKQEEKPK